MSFYVSCILLFLEMKRRAIAHCTATSEANIIHATQNIYIPYSNNRTSIKHTRHYTVLHVLASRNEKESYRNLYTDNICIYHTCYTTQIQSSMSCIFLLVEVGRRAITHLDETTYASTTRATQDIYIPYLKIHTSSKHTRPATFPHFLSPRNEKESYRSFYNTNICQYHTCYTTHI